MKVVSLFRKYGIVVAFVVLFLALSLMSPAFLTIRNLHNILDQSVHIGIVSAAMTLAIISGHYDLSVGAIFAFAGCLGALVAQLGYPFAGIVAAILSGLMLGILNGFVINALRVHSFIATLATGLVIRGVALVMTDGMLVVVDDPGFKILGGGTFWSVRYPVYIFALWIALTWFLLSRTTFGRYIYAIGSNAEAARLSGVRVELLRILVFGLSGTSAGLAGVITVSRIGQAQADIGQMLELEAIARTVIGGTSIMGGEGAVWRTLFGVLLMRVVSNGFNILNVPPFYQRIFEGAIILFAVGADTMARRRK